MYRKSDDGQMTILKLHKLNSFEKVRQHFEHKMLGSKAEKMFVANTPLGRRGQPEDIAKAQSDVTKQG